MQPFLPWLVAALVAVTFAFIVRQHARRASAFATASQELGFERIVVPASDVSTRYRHDQRGSWRGRQVTLRLGDDPADDPFTMVLVHGTAIDSERLPPAEQLPEDMRVRAGSNKLRVVRELHLTEAVDLRELLDYAVDLAERGEATG